MVDSQKPRQYYSVRTASDPDAGRLTLDIFRSLFLALYNDFRSNGYFVENFGFYCVDNHENPGLIGSNIENYVLYKLRRYLWPFENYIGDVEEDVLFDIIEFLFDHISKPLAGVYHTHGDCGMHWEKFDREAGRNEYRSRANELLTSYGPGYRINKAGEIMTVGSPELASLMKRQPPNLEDRALTRISAARDKFQRYGASLDDRRHAVRDLADVLELLRPEAKKIITKKDENDLFQLVNNFSIRHFNQYQKVDYDQSVWLSWMFHHLLATIHAITNIIHRSRNKNGK